MCARLCQAVNDLRGDNRLCLVTEASSVRRDFDSTSFWRSNHTKQSTQWFQQTHNNCCGWRD